MDTIKNHVVNITVGTAILCLIFMIGATWKLSAFMTKGDLESENLELKVSLVEKELESQKKNTTEDVKEINQKIGDLSVGMGQLKGALGIKD